MYHQNQGRTDLFTTSTTIPEEQDIFLLGGNGQGETGLVLSTDAKPRLKWTPELHQRFVDAVNQLGGAEKATPKTVMRIMGVPGLTLYHLKSHLQKYRLSKNLQAQDIIGTTKNALGCKAIADRPPGMNAPAMSNMSAIPQAEKITQISDALQVQIEVQRQLNEQLEVQRHLQLRIEAQGKYLQAVLEQAQETLGKQNLGSTSLEDAKMKMSELVSQVSSECFGDAITYIKENSSIHDLGARQIHCVGSFMNSRFTASEGFIKERKLNNHGGLKAYNDNSLFCTNQAHDQESQFSLTRSLSEHRMTHLHNSKAYHTANFGTEGNTDIPPQYVRAQKDGGGSSTSSASERIIERDAKKLYLEEPIRNIQAVEHPIESKQQDFELPCFRSKLGLNTHSINDADKGYRHFDLNSFSLS